MSKNKISLIKKIKSKLKSLKVNLTSNKTLTLLSINKININWKK